MKIYMLLFCGIMLFSIHVEASNPLTESNIYKKEDGGYFLNKSSHAGPGNDVVEGWGGFSMIGGSQSGSMKLNLARYAVHINDDIHIPVYIYATKKVTEMQTDTQDISADILNKESGLVNIMFTFQSDKVLEDSCGDDSRDYDGCFWGMNGGIKAIEYTDTDSTTSILGALYFSAGYAVKFPITENAQTGTSSVGQLAAALMLTGHVANTDKVGHLFPEKNRDNLLKTSTSIDFTVNLQIDEKFSIEASYAYPFNNRDVLDDSFTVSLKTFF